MKNVILLLTYLTLITSQGWAQPVLDATYGPRPGVQFSVRTDIGVPASTALQEGANQTWSYTSVGGFPPISFQVLAGPGHPSFASFSAATHRLAYEIGFSDTSFFYLRQNALGLGEVGSRQLSQYDRYTPDLPLIPYGLAFGQSRISTSLSYDSTPTVTFQKLRDTVTYSGYGSLACNGVAVSNAILITTRQGIYTSDRSGIDGPKLYNSVQQAVYVPGMGYPALGVMADHQTGAITTQYSVVALTSLQTANRPAISSALRLWPTSTAGPVHFRIPEEGAEPATARLLDAAGRAHVVPIEAGALDISGLASGLYLVELRMNNRLFRARVVRE